MDEWQSIVGNNRVPSYGSCIRALKTPSYHQKHFLKEGDTLQGLAIKFNSTMDELRRINKLYGNESIFLREYLLVPSPEPKTNEPRTVPGDEENSAGARADSSVSFKSKNLDDKKCKSSMERAKNASKSPMQKGDAPAQDALSFFQKYDKQIEASKSALSSFTFKTSFQGDETAHQKSSNTKMHKAVVKEGGGCFSNSTGSNTGFYQL